ncbi:ion transport protein domain-containing protein [Phthorimaea operculella]|nr:ion transport protein domain-containing protein [Phthorimaea operculella]
MESTRVTVCGVERGAGRGFAERCGEIATGKEYSNIWRRVGETSTSSLAPRGFLTPHCYWTTCNRSGNNQSEARYRIEVTQVEIIQRNSDRWRPQPLQKRLCKLVGLAPSVFYAMLGFGLELMESGVLDHLHHACSGVLVLALWLRRTGPVVGERSSASSTAASSLSFNFYVGIANLFGADMGKSLGKLCAAGGAPGAGSVLDRVISQPDSEAHTVLYKLADYKKGGLLLETYTKGGMAAAERLIREEFSAYMYAGGRGRVINRAEYLRWKFRDQEQVVLPIEASLSPHDPLAKWEDHMACWQMCYRGALGESLLHVLIICDTKIHTRLARALVKCFPKLSLDVVEGEEYLGASSLHLAIAYSNNELAQDLVEAGANVQQRAIGSFFLPRDQQKNPPARQTNYEGLAYLGEYPLAWAACCANEAVYNLLLDSDADPDAQDSLGNMILHMVVVGDKLDMFGYALRHPKVPASNGRMNKAGFTPLTLACHLGRASVFREMLELSAKEFWRYSNITCSAYPLNALDTLLPDGRTNWNSALFIILNGTKQEHLNMLDGGIIQRLLEEKWNTFASNKFLKRLMIFMLHLLLLSISVYLRHSSLEAEDNPSWGLEVNDVRSGIRLASEIGTIISTLCYIILQQGDEIKNQGLVAYLKQLLHEPAKLIFLMSNFLLLACIPARLSEQTMLEEALLIFLLPGSWFLLMFFAGAVKLTGPFVTMIYSMITGDMFTFGIIYCIVLFGFSQSFFFLYRGFPSVQSTLFSSYPSTWMALFQITLGDYSYTDLAQTSYPNLAKTVFAVFMVFVPILLLNMLIAMMGNTYAHVIEQSEKEWVKQWAKIVVSLERSVAQEDAHRYLQEYSIGLGPSDDPRYEQRAVMVIKSKAKTRAKQRKGALANWKRVGKVTIAELRRRGITGEDLRRLMWGRASISSPTKTPLIKAPPPDCVTDGLGSQLVNSALASTLNVAAFTELDF